MSSLFVVTFMGSFILLIIGFFNPNLSLFWYGKAKTRKKSLFIYSIFILCSIFLFGVTDDRAKSRRSTEKLFRSQNASHEEETTEGSWRTIYSFSGNGMKKSPVFELTGANARIRYNYSSQSDLGLGMFAAYVVEEGNELIRNGGVPEVMSSAAEESSESALHKEKGRYYLEINATGSWTVSVEEFN